MIQIFENVVKLDDDYGFVRKVISICRVMWENRYVNYPGWIDPLVYVRGVIGDCVSKLALEVEDVRDLKEKIDGISKREKKRSLFSALTTLDVGTWIEDTVLDKRIKREDKLLKEGEILNLAVHEISRILEINPSRVVPRIQQGYISPVHVKKIFHYYLMTSILQKGLGDNMFFDTSFSPTSKSGVQYTFDGYAFIEDEAYLVKCNTLGFTPLSQVAYIASILDDINLNSAIIFLRHPSSESVQLEMEFFKRRRYIKSFCLVDLAHMLKVFKEDSLLRYINAKVRS